MNWLITLTKWPASKFVDVISIWIFEECFIALLPQRIKAVLKLKGVQPFSSTVHIRGHATVYIVSIHSHGLNTVQHEQTGNEQSHSADLPNSALHLRSVLRRKWLDFMGVSYWALFYLFSAGVAAAVFRETAARRAEGTATARGRHQRQRLLLWWRRRRGGRSGKLARQILTVRRINCRQQSHWTQTRLLIYNVEEKKYTPTMTNSNNHTLNA